MNKVKCVICGRDLTGMTCMCNIDNGDCLCLKHEGTEEYNEYVDKVKKERGEIR